jgi:hypothetical protein
MAEARQLLPGFNHNVRHHGKLYHVQTEASGSATALVATHLFLGGNVVASRKTSYADLLGAEDLAPKVKKRMEAQHKDMLRELVRGAFDELERERSAQARAFAPGELVVDPAPPAPAPAPAEPSVAEPQAAAPVAPPPAATAAGPHDDVVEVDDVDLLEVEPFPLPADAPPAVAPAAPPVAARARPGRAARPPPVDGWGPPVLPRVQQRPAPAGPAAAAAAPPADRRLDELVLSYLAEDVGLKRERGR